MSEVPLYADLSVEHVAELGCRGQNVFLPDGGSNHLFFPLICTTGHRIPAISCTEDTDRTR